VLFVHSNLHTSTIKVEYMVISFDKEEKNATLALRQTEVLAKLSSIAHDNSSGFTEL